MIASSAFISSMLLLVWCFYLLGELRFLVPYRTYILHQFGTTIAWFLATVLVNLFAVVYAIHRKLLLKDTGRKLAHVEKQIRTGSSISDELTERLAE